MVKKSTTKSSKSTPRERTVPIPSTLEYVRGYGTLCIYKIEASPFYQMRYFEKRVFRKSTKQIERSAALKFAKEYFGELKGKQMNKLPLTKHSGFEVCARGLLKDVEARVNRGEVAERKLKEDSARLESDLLPFFKRYSLAEINYRAINDYLSSLGNPPRNLCASSLKVHLSHIKTILRYAHRMGVIGGLPEFPTIKTVDTPRPWFNSAEYSKLHNKARTSAGKKFTIETKTKKGKSAVRNGELTHELYDLILFMTNTFIRPTDIRLLQHKHVSIIKGNEPYLKLQLPTTKKHSSDMVSMPKAVSVYKILLERQKCQGYGKPDDFLFQPQHPANRAYALQQLQRQFDYLLKITGLKKSSRGESRSLYSLRHTAIMFRLTNSDGLDILTLARAARTSPEMLNRFYAKHLTAEMNIDLIHSKRKRRKEPIEKSQISG